MIDFFLTNNSVSRFISRSTHKGHESLLKLAKPFNKNCVFDSFVSNKSCEGFDKHLICKL